MWWMIRILQNEDGLMGPLLILFNLLSDIEGLSWEAKSIATGTVCILMEKLEVLIAQFYAMPIKNDF